LSDIMKAHLMGLLQQGLSLKQSWFIIRHMWKKKVLKNEPITQDTFVLPSYVINLSRKRVNELWQKHPKDLVNVWMWVMENLNAIFYYVEHAPMDLNLPNQDDIPFTLGIQTP
jgi:hypothetical protein